MKVYDVIVVGGGHAGIEAALAANRLKRKILFITMNPDKIGEMSCNPSIGGLAKGQIVREIDALGGEMAKNIDKTGIQFRLLNTRKGPAVQSPRAQADKKAYSHRMRNVLEQKANIKITMDLVTELIIEKDKVSGVKGLYNGNYYSKTVVLTPGTFLKGRLHIGNKVFTGGRLSEQAADSLGDYLKSIGLPVKRLKTGTPARIDGNSINFSKLEIQNGDKNPVPFSFQTDPEELKKIEQRPCYKTYTNEETHNIIEKNINLSAIHAGNIVGTGPRYCPSIEDKVEKFPEKDKHQIFIEPEGLYTNEYYLNGISTSLPVDIQHKFLHTIKGLEKAKIVRYAYAVEYDYVEPYILKDTLETKPIKNLFHAGQINGTSGYEEAAGQGLLAGANAALKTRGKSQISLSRDEAYIGVLIDDLITKGTKEPYRMFTSRAEYRLLLRADNADERLFEKGYKAGLVSSKYYTQVKEKYASINNEINNYKEIKFYTDNKKFNKFNGKTIYEMLKMPEMDINRIKKLARDFSPKIRENYYRNIEIKAKYSGYIKKERQKIKKFRKMENKKLPIEFDYNQIKGLTNEAVEKLNKYKPTSIGQASRISGITPADISVLIFYFENEKNKINKYIDLLLKYKKQINIIGTNQKNKIKTLVEDSIIELDDNKKVLDIGSGAGIPGLPNKIKNPSIKITFLDKARKKMNLLTHIMIKLNINYENILIGEVSDFFEKYKKHFDIILTRGLGDIGYILNNSIPFLSSNGKIYIWKPKDFKKDFIQKNKYNIRSISVLSKKECNIIKLIF